ncbi:MAG: biopolymer transporter ExbD, partial [Myxococcales bacterium]|nr:biopolymer transporter ExbD [Myxococcales bacterium]
MNFRDTRRRRQEVTLDLTPLIDCVFLLLIFFLVTA